MSTVLDAKKALLEKLESLVESTTSPSDTISMIDTLKTLDTSADVEVPPNPSPEFHYRNWRPEYGVWYGHHGNSNGGTAQYDKFGTPIRQNVFWCHTVHDGLSAWYGAYAGDMQNDYYNNYCWFSRQSHTTGTELYANRTTANGELGSCVQRSGPRAHTTGTSEGEKDARAIEMHKCGNAEIDNRECYLTYDNVTLKHKLRGLHVDQTPLSSYIAQSGVQAHYGGVTYNKTRKELAVINQYIDNSLNTNFQMGLYKTVPRIDRDTNLTTLLGGISPLSYKYQQTSAYNAADKETYENNKIILCDNGKFYVTTMTIASNQFNISSLTRPGWTGLASDPDFGIIDDATQTLTFTTVQDKTLAAGVKGTQENAYAGQMTVQSRSRNNVACFCPYANYSNGISMYIVDKRRSSHYDGYSWNNTSFGAMVGPLGNDDFVILKSQNWDTISSQTIIHYIQKSDGSWIETDYGNQMEHGGGMSTQYPNLVTII